jgi:hypothetical protein
LKPTLSHSHARRAARRFRAVAALILALLCGALLAQSAIAATHVTTDIKANTTWTTAGSPYLLDKQVKVVAGVTLTIQPGVEVDFNGGQTLTFFVAGKVNAAGTESNRIKFTSIQGAGGAGAPGQYKGITVIGATASANFSYADFEYGGYGSGIYYYGYGALTAQTGATLKLDHVTVRHNEYAGLKVADSNTEVSHSRFVENGDGISQIDTSPGPLTVAHSEITDNTQDGLFFNFSKESTTTGATIENNEISRNGRAGIEIWSNCSAAPSAFPHGHGNDIAHNGPNTEYPSDGSEIKTLYPCEALAVDWTGNYWGAATFIENREALFLRGFVCKGTYFKEWYEAAGVQSSGYLAYSAYERNALVPPPGPISTSSYATTEPFPCYDKTVDNITVKHVYNAIYLAPGEIASEPIPIE